MTGKVSKDHRKCVLYLGYKCSLDPSIYNSCSWIETYCRLRFTTTQTRCSAKYSVRYILYKSITKTKNKLINCCVPWLRGGEGGSATSFHPTPFIDYNRHLGHLLVILSAHSSYLQTQSGFYHQHNQTRPAEPIFSDCIFSYIQYCIKVHEKFSVISQF